MFETLLLRRLDCINITSSASKLSVNVFAASLLGGARTISELERLRKITESRIDISSFLSPKAKAVLGLVLSRFQWFRRRNISTVCFLNPTTDLPDARIPLET